MGIIVVMIGLAMLFGYIVVEPEWIAWVLILLGFSSND